MDEFQQEIEDILDRVDAIDVLDVLLIGIPISSFGSLSEERQNVRLLEPYTGPR